MRCCAGKLLELIRMRPDSFRATVKIWGEETRASSGPVEPTHFCCLQCNLSRPIIEGGRSSRPLVAVLPRDLVG